MALPAASTIEPAAELVDKLDKLVAAALIVGIAEYLPVFYRIFDLSLAVVEVHVQFVWR